MRHRTITYPFIGLTVLLLTASGLIAPCAHAQEIIANKQVPANSLNLFYARTIFAGKVRNWPNGLPIQVFVFDDKDPKHLKFCKERIDVFPRQLRRSWDRIIFTGLGATPQVVDSEEEMIQIIKTTPGAIGYVISLEGAEEYVIPVE